MEPIQLDVAGTATLLQYSVAPPQVYVSSTVSLVVTITNPVTAQPVVFGDDDEIQIQFPNPSGSDPLTDTLPSQSTSSDPSFTVGLSPGTSTYLVQPFGFGGATLQPGDSIMVTFANVVVDSSPGTPSLTFQEYIGATSGSTTIPVQKLPLTLSVVAWLQQLAVGLNQSTTLYWMSAGNVGVMVAGFPDSSLDPACPPSRQQPGQRCFPVSGSPPYSGSAPVSVAPANSSQPYTVIAYTGDGQTASTQVVLQQRPPYIVGFGTMPGYAKPTAPLAADASLALQWKTFYASAWVTNPAGKTISRDANPTAPLVVNPAMDAAAAAGAPWTGIRSTATYTLNATGFQQNQSAQVTAQLLPAQVRYFKFTEKAQDGTLSGVGWLIDPVAWPALNVNLSAQPFTLTVFQPGGTSTTLYLGSGDTAHPQVQYFAATPGEGQQQTLSWVTANVTSLVLTPGDYTVPQADIASGTYAVTVSAATDYVLTATAASGEVITSTLSVQPATP